MAQTNKVNKFPDEKSCGIVLFYENDGSQENRNDRLERQYLILHYPGGHFDFPKGHVEKGEENDEQTTAARELLEENGISDLQFIPGFR